jgi:hypothetical protein
VGDDEVDAVFIASGFHVESVPRFDIEYKSTVEKKDGLKPGGEEPASPLPLKWGGLRRVPYVTKRLAAAGKPRTRVNAARPPAPPLPSPKRLSFDWVGRREEREDEQQARLAAIRGRDAGLSAAL